MSLTVKQTVWRPSAKKASDAPPSSSASSAVPTHAPAPLPSQSTTETSTAAVPLPASPQPPQPAVTKREECTMDGLTEEEHRLLRRLRQVLPPLDDVLSEDSDNSGDHRHRDGCGESPSRTERGEGETVRSTSTHQAPREPHQRHNGARSLLEEDAERTSLSLVIIANVTYRENCIRRCLRHWRSRRARHAAQERRRTYFAEQYHHRTLLYVLFRAWAWRFRQRQRLQAVAREAGGMHHRFLQKCVWRRWRVHVSHQRAARTQAAVLAEAHAQRIRQHAWEAWTSTVHARSLAGALSRVQDDILREGRFHLWREWTYGRQRQTLMLVAAQPLLCVSIPNAVLVSTVPRLPFPCNRSGEDTHAEIAWRHSQTVRGAWIQWLKWTCRQRARRLEAYEETCALLRRSVAQRRLHRAWSVWLLAATAARMHKRLSEQLGWRYLQHWLALGRDAHAAAQHNREISTTRPLKRCFTLWQHRFLDRTQKFALEAEAERFYWTRHLLQYAWRVWLRRQREAHLDSITLEGRTRLLKYIALQRLIDHTACMTAASDAPAPTASTAVIPSPPSVAPVTAAPEVPVGDGGVEFESPPAPLTALLTAPRRPPIPLAPTPHHHVQPSSAPPNTSPPPPVTSQPTAGPLPQPSQWPATPSWVGHPPYPFPASFGWYAAPPTVQIPYHHHNVSVLSSGMPSPSVEGWPGLFYAQAPPSTVESAPAEGVPVQTRGEKRGVRELPSDCRRHHRRTQPPRVGVPSSRSSSLLSASSSSDSSLDSARRSHARYHRDHSHRSVDEDRSAQRGTHDRQRRSVPPVATNAHVPRLSLVPAIPTLTSSSGQLWHEQQQQRTSHVAVSPSPDRTPSSPDALYQEGKRILTAYKARKAAADGEEAELAAVEAELRLYEHVQMEKLSLQSDVLTTSTTPNTQGASPDRIRYLQERFVQLHQRRLQREQLKAQLRQFVSLLRSQDHRVDTSLMRLFDSSVVSL